MKIYISIALFMAGILTICAPSKASSHQSFIEAWAQEVEQAPSKEASRALIIRPMNINELYKPYWDEIDQKALYEGVGPGMFAHTIIKDGVETRKINFHKTNILMLAIAHGYVKTVSKLLNYIDDVNDPMLTAWGYRQPYWPAHMAVDQAVVRSSISLEDRLAIIDLLGQKGADFNIMPGDFEIGIYNNPPLIAGTCGLHIIDDTFKLLARAVLYGADPMVQGSSGSFVCINPTSDCPLGTFGSQANSLCQIAFDDFMVQSKLSKNLKLAPSVVEKFKKIKEERLKQLSALPF